MMEYLAMRHILAATYSGPAIPLYGPRLKTACCCHHEACGDIRRFHPRALRLDNQRAVRVYTLWHKWVFETPQERTPRAYGARSSVTINVARAQNSTMNSLSGR